MANQHCISIASIVRNENIRFTEVKGCDYTDQRYATHNPCTMVFKLVRQLTGKDEELNSELTNKIEE
ncbi:MAG: hypothetical protein J6W37_02325 [Bacteroidales bacterium]|nr:hypothetical protein [Bacteroidales bacterium]